MQCGFVMCALGDLFIMVTWVCGLGARVHDTHSTYHIHIPHPHTTSTFHIHIPHPHTTSTYHIHIPHPHTTSTYHIHIPHSTYHIHIPHSTSTYHIQISLRVMSTYLSQSGRCGMHVVWGVMSILSLN